MAHLGLRKLENVHKNAQFGKIYHNSLQYKQGTGLFCGTPGVTAHLFRNTDSKPISHLQYFSKDISRKD